MNQLSRSECHVLCLCYQSPIINGVFSHDIESETECVFRFVSPTRKGDDDDTIYNEVNDGDDGTGYMDFEPAPHHDDDDDDDDDGQSHNTGYMEVPALPEADGTCMIG